MPATITRVRAMKPHHKWIAAVALLVTVAAWLAWMVLLTRSEGG